MSRYGPRSPTRLNNNLSRRLGFGLPTSQVVIIVDPLRSVLTKVVFDRDFLKFLENVSFFSLSKNRRFQWFFCNQKKKKIAHVLEATFVYISFGEGKRTIVRKSAIKRQQINNCKILKKNWNRCQRFLSYVVEVVVKTCIDFMHEEMHSSMMRVRYL